MTNNCSICSEITLGNFYPKPAGFRLELQGKAVFILTDKVHVLSKKKWLQEDQVLDVWLSRT